MARRRKPHEDEEGPPGLMGDGAGLPGAAWPPAPGFTAPRPDAAARVGRPSSGPPPVAEIAARVAESVQVGLNRDGHTEVRVGVTQGALEGLEVRLAATPAGVAVTFLAETEAARRALEAPLVELTQALAERGVTVDRVEVTVRADVGDRRGGRADAWDEAGPAPTAVGRRAPGALPLGAAASGTDYVA
jgi:hypothetical protein